MYTALYRKLRPKKFSDVVGQSHIIQTLQNQINSERIFHAYLFCGTRGTGKTSTAKIFAAAVNCTDPKGTEPCGECQVCREIERQNSLNVIEIDAASNNGVENIRDIREEVRYAPTEGKYKVYIIDEVHMLSAGAFNALLKTLEEPPSYVIFILATTDPHKIPATIHSRCQRFDFRRITTEEMVQAIKGYSVSEGINIEDEALRYIVRICDGAMRDALSILDQCVTFFYGENITLEKVLGIVGSSDDAVFFKITQALNTQNSQTCLDIIQETVMSGRDISRFVTDLTVHLRNLLISKNTDFNSHALDLSAESKTKYKEFAENISQDTLIYYLNELSALQQQMKFSSNERILFEVLCIKLCHPFTSDSRDALITRLESLEKALEQGIVPQNNISTKEEIKPKSVPTTPQPETDFTELTLTGLEDLSPKKSDPPAEPPTDTVNKDELKQIQNHWNTLINNIKMPTIKLQLSNSKPVNLQNDLLTIEITSTTDEKILDFIKSKEILIKQDLETKFNKTYSLKFTLPNPNRQNSPVKSNFTDLPDEYIIISDSD